MVADTRDLEWTRIEISVRCRTTRRGGRVVECGSLENCFRVTPNGGSNPPLSVELDVALSPVLKLR